MDGDGDLRRSVQVEERTVSVGGRTVRALCTPGPVEVLLLHGESASADSWRPVLQRLGDRVGACAYDRVERADSAGLPEARGWFELLAELQSIHQALAARTPYVLVGHSLGGLYARLYAADRPVDVAGLLLLDPAHEDMPGRVRRGMPRERWEEWMADRQRPNEDGVLMAAVAERARTSRLPRVPVTVLTATRRRSGEGWNPRVLDEVARNLHGEIIEGVARGRHVPAQSGHDVPREAPDLVVEELLRLLGLVQASSRGM